MMIVLIRHTKFLGRTGNLLIRKPQFLFLPRIKNQGRPHGLMRTKTLNFNLLATATCGLRNPSFTLAPQVIASASFAALNSYPFKPLVLYLWGSTPLHCGLLLSPHT